MMLETHFARRCFHRCHFFEDVPSEIVILGSVQGALGAILGSVWSSCFIVFKHFKHDIKTMLRTSHFLKMSLAKWGLVCRVGRDGIPCSCSFSEDVPSENVIFKMIARKTPLSTYHVSEDVSGDTLTFHAHRKP